MLVLTVRGFYTHVTGDFEEKRILSKVLTIFDPKAKHNRDYKSGEWDGNYRLYDEDQQVFMSGLTKLVAARLRELEIEVTINVEPMPFPLPAPDTVSTDVLDGVTLRDYQANSIRKFLIHGGGVACIPTGGGKTNVAAALIKTIDRRSLVLVHTKLLAKQTVKRFKSYGIDKVGLIGDGVFKPGKTTIATVQSLAEGLSDYNHEVQDFLKRQEVLVLDECFVYATPVVCRTVTRTPIDTIKPGETISGDAVSPDLKYMFTRGKPETRPIGFLVETKFDGEVLSFNRSTRQWEWKQVTNWMQKESGDKYLHYLRTHLYEKYVYCTSNHKFPVWGGNDTEAGQLFPGETLYLAPSDTIPNALGPTQQQALIGLLIGSRATIDWKGRAKVILTGMTEEFRASVIEMFPQATLENDTLVFPRLLATWNMRKRYYDGHVFDYMKVSNVSPIAISFMRGFPAETALPDPYPYGLDEIETIDRQSWSPQKTVYNITVEDNHNYVVDSILANNCCAGSTKILTPNGEVPLEEVQIGDKVVSPTGQVVSVVNKWKSQKEAFKFSYTGGYEVIASKDHPTPYGQYSNGTRLVPLVDAKRVFVNRATPIYRLPFTWEEWLLGFFLGDGHLHATEHSTGSKSYSITFGEKEDVDELARMFSLAGADFTVSDPDDRGVSTIRFSEQYSRYLTNKYGLVPGKKSTSFEVPTSVGYSVGVIKGLMDAEGTRSVGRIAFDICSEKAVDWMSDALAYYGIKTTKMKRFRSLDNPNHSDIFRVSICGDYINTYNARFGFELKRKENANLGSKWAKRHLIADLVSVEPLGVMDLYDIELDSSDRLFVGNGLILHNCHHAPAASWRRVALFMDNPYRFALSGTPFRDRGMDTDNIEDLLLRGLAGNLVVDIPVSYLKERGFVADPQIYMLPISEPASVGSMTYWQTVYEQGIVQNAYRNRLAAEAILRFVRAKCTVLVLVNQIEHGHIMLRQLHSIGIEAWMLKGGGEYFRLVGDNIETFSDDGEVLTSFSSGEYPVLIATQVMDEGVDLPECNALVKLGGGKSYIKTVQHLGRVLRPKGGDNKAYVVDFIDKQNDWLHNHSRLRMKEYTHDGHTVLDVADFYKDFPR